MRIDLNKRCRVEYPVKTQDSTYGSDVTTWTLLCVIWCEIRNELPSKTEQIKSGVEINTSRSRFRARYRSDISSEMRIICDSVTYHIVSDAAEIGKKEYIEFMVEKYE